MTTIHLNAGQNLIRLEKFDKDIIQSVSRYEGWKTYLRNLLKSYGILANSFDIKDQRWPVLKIGTDNLNFKDVKSQDGFLYSFAQDLGFPEVALHIHSSFSTSRLETTSIRYIESKEHGKSLHVWNYPEEIEPVKHIWVNKLWELSSTYLRKKYPTDYSTNSYSFTKLKNGDVSLEAGHGKYIPGMENQYKEVLSLLWDEAHQFTNALAFLDTNIEEFRFRINIESKSINFHITGVPNKFIEAEFDVAATFLGIERRFMVFSNEVSSKRSYEHTF